MSRAIRGAKDRPHTALVCDYDPLWLSKMKSRVKKSGFEILQDATTVPDALRWSDHLKPSLIVISNEHSGLTVLQALEDFRNQEHRPEVLVFSTSDVDRAYFLEHGAFLLVHRYDDDGADEALEEAKHFLTTGNRRKSDRRERTERRVQQDWKAVTSERRRNSSERRNDQRRGDGDAPTTEAPAGDEAVTGSAGSWAVANDTNDAAETPAPRAAPDAQAVAKAKEDAAKAAAARAKAKAVMEARQKPPS